MTTAADLERYDLIRQMGCVACRQLGFKSECDVHHRNLGDKAGQRRLGNQYTIGLCPWHHRGVPPGDLTQGDAAAKFGPSRAYAPRRFRSRFGTDEELQKQVDDWIKARRTER